VSKYKVICGSELAGEKHGEGETAAEWQPPWASGCETATSSRGWWLGVAKTPLQKKHQAPLPGPQNIEVVLRYFHRHRYKSSLLWFICWRWLRYLKQGVEEYVRDDDLCGSGRRKVTPYVHGAILCCIVVVSLKVSVMPLIAQVQPEHYNVCCNIL
jgi:hypothetical protein